MGMPGMTVEAVKEYANPAQKKDVEPKNKVTVAEYRNRINHITHYYDNWDFDSFWNDPSISVKQKIGVLLGEMFASVVDEDRAKEILKVK